MPTVHREGSYRQYFYSNEGADPPHVYIDARGKTAKFWLMPIGLAKNIGFSDRELWLIANIVRTNERKLINAWFEYFGP